MAKATERQKVDVGALWKSSSPGVMTGKLQIDGELVKVLAFIDKDPEGSRPNIKMYITKEDGVDLPEHIQGLFKGNYGGKGVFDGVSVESSSGDSDDDEDIPF